MQEEALADRESRILIRPHTQQGRRVVVLRSAGRYDLDWEDDTGGKRRATAAGREVGRGEAGGAIRRARRRVWSNKRGIGSGRKEEADETQLEGEAGLYQTERRLHGDVMIAIQ